MLWLCVYVSQTGAHLEIFLISLWFWTYSSCLGPWYFSRCCFPCDTLVYIFRQCYTVCWSLVDLSLSKSDKRSEESLYLRTKLQHGIQRTWVCDMWVCACMCRSMCEWLIVLPALFLKQHHFFLDKSLTAIVSPTATLLRPPLQRSVSILYST